MYYGSGTDEACTLTRWQHFSAWKKAKVKADIALHWNPISELLDVTCHMGSHSVTCNPTQVNAPRLTSAMQAGTRFTYPGGMEGWVDLVHLIAHRPGVKPTTFRSWVRRRTAAPPRHGRHLESLTSYQKSDSVNRCVFTRKTFLPNFTPIRFETTEP